MAADFAQIEEAFQAVLANQTVSREAALDAVCAGNLELRAEVAALLASLDKSADFLAQPAAEGLIEDLSDLGQARGETQWVGQQSLVDTPNESGGWGPSESLANTVAGDSIRSGLQATDALATLLKATGGKIDEFEVLEVVGTGGMGIVVKARDSQLDRVVALKIMKPFLADDHSARARFLQEARSVAKVVHPNVVTIHAVRDAEGLSYLVMEFIEGETLARRLERAPLDVDEIVSISRQAALGLAAAHKRGIVHRDVKPANILLLHDEQLPGNQRPSGQWVKISDFGLARVVTGSALTQSGVIIGTPQFMSPEQALGEALDQRSDLFSLGSVMYALCTGQPAFQGDSIVGIMRKVSDRPHASIHSLNPQIPDWLCAIVDRLMAKRPEDRIQTAAELATLLEQPTGGHGTVAARNPAREESHNSAGPPKTALKIPPVHRRARAVALLAGVALVAAAVIAISTGEFSRWGKPAETVVDRAVPDAARGSSADVAQDAGAHEALATGATSPEGRPEEWSMPANLGSPVNSPGYESGAHLSADGTTLLFHAPRDRAGGSGPLQMWQARRSSISGPFGEPTRLGDELNGEFVCVDPSMTEDSLVLVFGSERPDGRGGADVWMSVRSQSDVPWSAPFCLGAEVNSQRSEWEPEISADGLTLYFHSDRGEGFGGTDLWMGRRAALDEPFGAAVNLGAGVNTSANEGGAALAADGLSLIFHRVASGRVTLLRADRADLNAEFGDARPLLPDEFTDGTSTSAVLSRDGRELYFTMVQAAGQGGPDLWVARRVVRGGASPGFALAFDGRTSYVHVPTLSRNDGEPATLEGWVQAESQEYARVIAVWSGLHQLEVGKVNGGLFPLESQAPLSRSADNPQFVAGEWAHFAVVVEENDVRFYVNGIHRLRLDRQAARVQDVPSFDGTWFGAHPYHQSPNPLAFFFQGQLDEVRISRSARYAGNFIPAVRFEPDAETLALYHFDEGVGELLKDSSANHHHGKVVAPRWVPARR